MVRALGAEGSRERRGEQCRHPELSRDAARTLSLRSVIGAGFALPRDAGLKTGAPSRPRASSPPAVRGFAPLSGSGAGLKTGGPYTAER